MPPHFHPGNYTLESSTGFSTGYLRANEWRDDCEGKIPLTFEGQELKYWRLCESHALHNVAIIHKYIWKFFCPRNLTSQGSFQSGGQGRRGFLSFCKYNKKYWKTWLTQKLDIIDNNNDDDDNVEDDP